MTPILPLYMHDAFGYPAAMAMATVVGILFGFVLERSGFGRAPNLVAQFYGTDNRVLKVMFTAIATAAVGISALAGLGVMDLAAVSIPDTFVGPQVVGGLLLGSGFAISGYCPGTAVVAMGSGNRDGWWTLAGTMLGAVVFALAWPWVGDFYTSGALGRVTLPEALGLSWPVVSIGIVVIAVGAFFGAEALEKWLARRTGTQAPHGHPHHRNAVLAGMVVAGVLGLFTLGLPARSVARAVPEFERLSPRQLAEQLVTDPTSLWLVDLRDPEACAKARIPGATCLPADDPKAQLLASLSPTRPLVLYGQDTLAGLPDSVADFDGPVWVLDGGMRAFDSAVLQAPTPPANPTPQAVADYRMATALHGQLTGTSAPAAPVTVKAGVVRHASKKGGGC